MKKVLATGQRGIADGGYIGSSTLSTPNSHDNAKVRKFKSRALKQHEKVNSMFKIFKCLGDRHRHVGK